MPNTIPIHDWLGHINNEYLSTFVKDGGSSIKFAVTPDELRPQLDAALQDKCRELDYQFVKLDAVTSRAHMPQDIFFGLARQLDWRLLARRMLLRLARDRGFQVDGVDASGTGSIFDAIARTNGLESQFVVLAMTPGIQDSVFRNTKLARDFRVCMSHLCLAENTSEGAEYTGQALLDWLTGAVTRVSSVKPFLIYTPINRTTARYFIESALQWIRHVGYAGIVIVLDNSRVTLAPNPRDGLRYYTRAAAMEHYEVLREFVDRIDRLTGTLLVVAASYEFLDEASPKSYAIYQALYTRVLDDVHDRNLVNPVASLVRLS